MKTPILNSLPDDLRYERVLNFRQASELKGVSVATLRRQYKAGKLPVVRLSDRRLGLRVRDLIA